MDLRKLKKLIELLEESNLSQMELKEGEFSVKLSRSSGGQIEQIIQPQIQQKHQEVSSQQPTQTKQEQNTKKIEGHVQRSPMVGTFYKAPSPEEKPFASIGDKIKKGQVLCIIEAMKMMNQIEADKDGTITDILIDNGESVEYDEALFVIQ